MSALADLLRGTRPKTENQERPPANPANPANPDSEIRNVRNIRKGATPETHFSGRAGDHPEDVEFPREQTAAGSKTYFSERAGHVEKIEFEIEGAATPATPGRESSRSSESSSGARSDSRFSGGWRTDAERAADRRRKAVLAMLERSPESVRYAFRAFTHAHLDFVVVAFAIRDVGTAELSIERDRYDAFEFAAIIETEGNA